MNVLTYYTLTDFRRDLKLFANETSPKQYGQYLLRKGKSKSTKKNKSRRNK